MKVYVCFEFPEIADVDSPDADLAIANLTQDLGCFLVNTEYEDWYIDDATGDTEDETDAGVSDERV